MRARVRATVCVSTVGLAALTLALARPVRAESFWNDRLRIGGEVSGALAPEDDGYFNYGDYGNSTLRLFRVSLAAEVQPWRPFGLVAEVRSDNLGRPRVYALYFRLSPFESKELHLQLGRVPPVFGAFARRRYAGDNPLPSIPLIWQYLTTIRPDALPADADQILARRGQGWHVGYPIGDTAAASGLPVADAERWDTGIEVRLGKEPLALALAVTQGSLGAPRGSDDNGGKQLSGRLAWRPSPALTLGVSGSQGEYASREVIDALPEAARGGLLQRAMGTDVEFALGRWLARAEVIWSEWDAPQVEAPYPQSPLGAVGGFVEVRYKLMAGLFVGGRIERLTFSEIRGTERTASWDASVERVELGAGYALRRNALLRGSWQHNTRDGGRVRENDLVCGQLQVWF